MIVYTVIIYAVGLYMFIMLPIIGATVLCEKFKKWWDSL
jgi:glycopeptide antibiotics resistance protein